MGKFPTTLKIDGSLAALYEDLSNNNNKLRRALYEAGELDTNTHDTKLVFSEIEELRRKKTELFKKLGGLVFATIQREVNSQEANE